MNKLFYPFILAALFFACDEPEAPGAPSWETDYPKVAFGAVSADLIFKANRTATVHWLVTSSAVSIADAADLKARVATASGAPIVAKGATVIEAGGDVTANVTNLTQNKKYFTYIVAENTTEGLLQADVSASAFTTYSRQDTLSFQSTVENRKVSYLIYRPEDALKYPEKKHPICFFLGGNGEIAAQGAINVIRNGSLAEYIHKGGNPPMMVMTIQHTKGDWNANMIHEGVTHGLATYPVDEKKVYMSGISGGGFGCWSYAVDHASILAAIVPISGGGNTSKACNLNGVAVSAFTNKNDGIVNPTNTINMLTAINACQRTAGKADLLIFPDDGHDCWRRVYNQNHGDWGKSPSVPKFDIYAWMLSKSK